MFSNSTALIPWTPPVDSAKFIKTEAEKYQGRSIQRLPDLLLNQIAGYLSKGPAVALLTGCKMYKALSFKYLFYKKLVERDFPTFYPTLATRIATAQGQQGSLWPYTSGVVMRF